MKTMLDSYALNVLQYGFQIRTAKKHRRIYLRCFNLLNLLIVIEDRAINYGYCYTRRLNNVKHLKRWKKADNNI